MGSFLIAHMKVRYSPNHYLLLHLRNYACLQALVNNALVYRRLLTTRLHGKAAV